MKVGRPLADRKNEEKYSGRIRGASMITTFAVMIANAALLRFGGAVAGVIALFWLIRVLFDRLDRKAH